MSTNIPFHDQQAVYGVSEDCKYNDHQLCRSSRCGCSCHRQARVEADRAGVHHVTGQASITVPTGLDKYCPKCKVKAPSEQNYCKVDGSKLSSLRCPECQTPGDEADNYCGYCGAAMKVEERELEAAAIGDIENIISSEPIVHVDSEIVDAEAAMRAAMANRASAKVTAKVTKVTKVTKVSNVSKGMFK